jgi:hypothetical protein
VGFQTDGFSLMRVARYPLRALISPWRERNENWCKQEAHGRQLMAAFEAYAIEIGCTIVQDSIDCHNEEQARKLAAWWTEKTSA